MGEQSKGWFKPRREARRARARARQSRVIPTLEALEDRVTPAIYNVNTTADVSIAAGVNSSTGVINGSNGVVTLRSAIEASNATPGSNTIDLTLPGTYQIQLTGTPGENDNLAGEFAITGSSLTILDTSGSPVVIDGGTGNSRVFEVGTSAADNSRVTNGSLAAPTNTTHHGEGDIGTGPSHGGGGIVVGFGGGAANDSNLILNNVIVANNSALAGSANGGGIDLEGDGTLTLNGSTVSGNVAGSEGGGIAAGPTGSGGSVLINNSLITGNSAAGAAGLDVIGGRGGSTVVTINTSTVSNNSATFGGGGVNANGSANISITKSLISGNKALATSGGGVSAFSGAGTVSISINTSEITGNVANGNGGGVFVSDASATLSVLRSTIDNNTASTGMGGGIAIGDDSGTSGNMLVNDTITGNVAGSDGGGVAIDAGTLALVNDTINKNTVTGTGNTGGGIFNDANVGGLTLLNTIVASNNANAGATGPDLGGATAYVSLGGNLIGQTTGATINTASKDQFGTALNPINPQLAALANNGGPLIGDPAAAITLPTEAELPNSPAIDAGLLAGAPSTDERGFPRPDQPGTSPDIGAFERQAATLTVKVQPSATTVSVGGKVSFTTTVTNTSTIPLPADNTTVTVTVPAGLTILSAPGGTITGNTVTFTLGALAAGAKTSFTVNTIAKTLGTQTVTAAVTSPDTNPAAASATISVATAPIGTPNVLITAIRDTYTSNSQIETIYLQVNFENTPVPVGAVTVTDGGMVETVGLNSTGDAVAQFIFPFGMEIPYAHTILAQYNDNAGGTLFHSAANSAIAPNTSAQYLIQVLFDLLLLGL